MRMGIFRKLTACQVHLATRRLSPVPSATASRTASTSTTTSRFPRCKPSPGSVQLPQRVAALAQPAGRRSRAGEASPGCGPLHKEGHARRRDIRQANIQTGSSRPQWPQSRSHLVCWMALVPRPPKAGYAGTRRCPGARFPVCCRAPSGRVPLTVRNQWRD
jgi:hypothetical protein